jgi:hypothetical protein
VSHLMETGSVKEEDERQGLQQPPLCRRRKTQEEKVARQWREPPSCDIEDDETEHLHVEYGVGLRQGRIAAYRA